VIKTSINEKKITSVLIGIEPCHVGQPRQLDVEGKTIRDELQSYLSVGDQLFRDTTDAGRVVRSFAS
jgi:hypothetical protein